MKRKFNLKTVMVLVALLLVGLQINAQTRRSTNDYHEDYGYDLMSNLSIYPYGIGTCQLFSDGKEFNGGAGILVSRKSFSFLSLRALAEVNGFKNTGKFDRFGKLMAGASLDLGRAFYIFSDFGTAYNPSDRTSKYRLSFEGGLGVNIRLNNTVSLSSEVLIDRTQSEKTWKSNGEVRVGLKFNTGITEGDKTSIQIMDNVPNRLEELGNRAKLAEDLNKEYMKTLDTMNQTLVEANKMIGKLRKEIVKCEAEKEDCIKSSDFPDIYFKIGSYDLTEFELDKLVSIAEVMSQKPNEQYVIYGYCSNDGKDDTNLILAENRCYKVIDVLKKLGIESYRILEVVPVGKNITWADGTGTINRFVRIVKK
jgi:outer membrane protein OmpA-like peptidoglycan-associated protein